MQSTTQQLGIMFPRRLYNLLEVAKADGFEDVISWLPCGTGFKIHDQKAFIETILYKYFHLRIYKSFVRNLNLYGIKQTIPTKGVYSQPCFIRGKPELLSLMKRNVKRRSRKRQPSATLFDCKGDIMPPAEPYRIQESPHHSQLREGTTSFACRDDTCQLTTEDASQLHNILVDEECASSTSIGSVLSYAHEERLLQFYIVMPMTVAAQQLPFSELCEEIISTFLE